MVHCVVSQKSSSRKDDTNALGHFLVGGPLVVEETVLEVSVLYVLQKGAGLRW